MRWATKSTWIRIAVLFGIYLLVLAAWFGLSRVSDSMEIVKSLVFLILLAILPILAMAFGAWDGVKEGFSRLSCVSWHRCTCSSPTAGSSTGWATACSALQPTASARSSMRAARGVYHRVQTGSPSPSLRTRCPRDFRFPARSESFSGLWTQLAAWFRCAERSRAQGAALHMWMRIGYEHPDRLRTSG